MVGWCDMVESDSVILYRFTCIIIPSYIAAFACITLQSLSYEFRLVRANMNGTMIC